MDPDSALTPQPRGDRVDRTTETVRLEAFSDGVIAIAITLLVLEIRSPDTAAGGLGRALLHEWPSYAAYLVSFLVIGVMWVNHHAVFRSIARTDRMLMFLNLLLLMAIAVIPFPTAVVAAHLDGDPADARAATVLYSVVSLLVGLGFGAVRWWSVSHPYLLQPTVDVAAATAAQRNWRFYVGSVVYLGLVGVAFVSPIACMAGHLAAALYYVRDQLPVPPAAPASPDAAA